ncbi:MAG TPA: SPOR domain-containing protein [Candidatus Angelobacter sp.]|nr:SPOR domain-containing protein [Candidatus Angelobacter sp.]
MSESRDSDQLRDTEITLGTGKLLGIFFFLAILCGVFFTLGYMLGKSTGSGSTAEIVGTVPSSGSAAGKPTAGNKATQASAQPSSDATHAPSAPAGGDSSSAKAPDASSGQPPASNKTPDQSNTAATSGDKSTPSGSYMVQVAAVSKQEDAEFLKSALQKKQYPVFIATSANDPLFHVQVGPFTDRKDAEAMKTRLAADGYGAIVK